MSPRATVTHRRVRFRGENLQAVDVRFRPPVLRVLLRPVLPDALVTAVAHQRDDHNHAAEHRPAKQTARLAIQSIGERPGRIFSARQPTASPTPLRIGLLSLGPPVVFQAHKVARLPRER